MNRRENSFKKYLMKIMGTRWDAQSHEDQYSEGIPDLSFGANGVNGWIELKQIESWPKLETTPAMPKKYTSEQINWSNKRQKKGNHCWILIKVGKTDYFLFTPDKGRDIKNGMAREEYINSCVKWWWPSLDPQELLNLITE